MNRNYIRNFAIVAHIDHGKSTLADRLLEMTGTVEKREMKEQFLDSNPIERERGITIKLAPVRMKYVYKGEEYILNLIDTPGHVDFSYEVSRSLSACEGILLVVDASQGIQAQTLAHMQLITAKNLKVIPILNKVDLPSADIEGVEMAMVDTFGFKKEEIIPISAKNGTNIDAVLKAIIERIPKPAGDPAASFRSLVFSSNYDSHRGVVVFIRVVDGEIHLRKLPSPTEFMATGAQFFPIELGFFTPTMQSVQTLNTGEVGYIATGLKDLTLARVGDTIRMAGQKTEALAGYKEPKPMVYLSFFPTDGEQYLELRQSLEKLHLSDSSFTYQPYSSAALGKGFLCGFLGLLHADVVRERLEKEFELNVIATAPTVEYKVELSEAEVRMIHTPEDFPDPSIIRKVSEPVMYTTVYTPKETVGQVMQLAEDKRAEYINLEYMGNQAIFTYVIPLSEMIIDFFDKLKSVSQGYASLDYEFLEYRAADVVKLDILLNHKRIDAFSQICVRENVVKIANAHVVKLKKLIPSHQFQIPVQAAVGGKIIARADIKSFRKDVTQKLYGGDRTRKDKLLEAQKKGKKRMRQFGSVEIPQEVFLQVYKQ